MFAKSKYIQMVVAIVAVLALVLTACGTPAAPAAPTTAPVAQPTTAPAAQPTTAPAAQPTAAMAEPTQAPAAGGGTGLGTEGNPIKMAFVPSTDSAKVLASGEKIAAMMEAQTGLKFEVSVPTSYAAVLEAMNADQIDVAWLAPVQYVVGRNKSNAELLLTVTRNGTKQYPFQILVLKDSSIQSVADLKGKKFAFTDPLSASGNLYPRAYLLEQGINPDTDLQPTYAGGHDKVVIAVYNGQVDAGATFGEDAERGVKDARNNVVKTIADVYDKTRVLYNSGPIIPNDTVSVRKGLDQALKQKVADGLMALAKTEEGLQEFRALYNIDGFVPGNPADYDPILKAADAAKIDLGEALQPPPTRPAATPTAAATPGG